MAVVTEKSHNAVVLGNRALNADEPEIALNHYGRSYYIFCLEQALLFIDRARLICDGEEPDENHELALLQGKLKDALGVA